MEELSYVDLNKEAFEIVDEAARLNISILQKGQEQLNKYCDDLAGSITETTDTTMMNSLDGRLLVEKIGGTCEQVSTTGKNLLDISYFANGYWIESGANTSTYNARGTNDIVVEPNTQYHFSANASVSVIRLHEYDADGNYIKMSQGKSTDSVTITTTENTRIIRWSFNYTNKNNVTLEICESLELMIVKGSERGDYEPYTGGSPAPSLDHPQETKKSVVSQIKTHGKNFLDCRGLTEQTINGVTFTPVYQNGMLQYINVNGTPTANTDYTIKRMDFIANTEYAINGCPSGGSNGTYFFAVNGTTASNFDVGNGNTFSFDSNKNANVLIRVIANVTVNNLKFYPMIREASIEDATYEPYTESVITLSQPIELYGNGDLQDVIEDGKIKRRFGEIVYNGSENWTREVTALGFVRFYRGILGSLNLSYRSEIFTTHFRYSRGGQTDGSGVYVFHQAKIHLYADFDTVEEFKAWLAANNVTVIYPLEEEVVEELPLADQIALNSLQTFNGVTYVEFDCEVLPTLKSKYGTTEVGRIAIESYCDSNLNSIGLQKCKQDLAYKNISSLIQGADGLYANAYTENGMVVIQITVPKTAVPEATAIPLYLSDIKYAPQLEVVGSYRCVNEDDKSLVFDVGIGNTGSIGLKFKGALTGNVIFSFVYPARRDV